MNTTESIGLLYEKYYEKGLVATLLLMMANLSSIPFNRIPHADPAI